MFVSTSSLLVVLADTGLDPTEHTGTAINTEQILQALIGTVIPIVVALVTKKVSDSRKFKSFILIGLNALTAVLTEWLGAGSFVWQQALFGFILSVAVGVGFLEGVWKPQGVSDAAFGVLRKD